ncbi:hypothetical protein ACHWQZ_G016040 [Mnemiopsis leidyi]
MFAFTVILFVLCFSECRGTCPLEKSAVPESNVKFASAQFDDNNLALLDDKEFVMECTDSKHVFVNGVRAVENVNITRVDIDGKITGTCTVNNMIPNIFVKDVVNNDYNQGTRKFYCARGCNPIRAAGQTIKYPSIMLGNEANSPPIRISDEKVTVSCAPKFAQAVGDAGKTEVQCQTGGANGWTPSFEELIKCVNGCPDIRNISNGFTRAQLTGQTGEPPFTIGDILPFECNAGYHLVGYKTTTCTSDYQWSNLSPECVLVSMTTSSAYNLNPHHPLIGVVKVIIVVFLWFT